MLVRLQTTAWTLSAAASFLFVGVIRAQQSAVPPVAAAAGPAVNDVAPDFTLAGATRYGLLQTAVRLSDYRGRTVVLAFFFQARTKG